MSAVAPTTLPLLDAIVTLWLTGEALLKSIVTLPADEVTEVLSNFS